MRILLAAVLLAASVPEARALSFGKSQAGASAATFLSMGADARAAGMGGAVDAAADDASALYWNPADLAGLHYRDATFTHSASYQSTFYDFLAYAQPIESGYGTGRERNLRPDQLGAVGGAVQYQNSGRIAEVDNTGTATGQSFTPQDLAATVGWGAELFDGLDAGVDIKYVSSQIEATAVTAAADFGARWRVQIPETEIGYALAANARNVGGGLKFNSATDPLPLALVLGQSLHPTRSLAVDLDVTAPRDAPLYASFGVEWRAPMIQGVAGTLRAGYDGRTSSSGIGGTTGVCFGGGLEFQRLGLDYAWTPAGNLGDVQKLSLSYRF